MEAAIPAAPAPGAVERGSDAVKRPADVFRWSEYVHLGTGAQECEAGRDGTCEDPAHFHAFCRLPNQFQHADIRQRAQAAKARRMRLLRDPASDAFAVIDNEMADALRAGDLDAIVDELINGEFWKHYTAAQAEVREDERFEHIDRDRDRLAQLDELDPDGRDNDEREELVRHVAAYSEEVERRRKEAMAPKRRALGSLTKPELVDQLRETRITAEGNAAFMESYSKWEWFACTLRPVASGRPAERVFASIEELENADRDVLEAIGSVFSDLEAAFQRGPTGNS